MMKMTQLNRVCLMGVSLAMGLMTGACEDEPTEPELPGELVRSDLERNLSPNIPPGNLEELVAGNTAFAVDAYQQLSQAQGNIFYSPLSVSLAMAMTYAGARTDTEAQMASALHYTLPQADLHPAFNKLDLELASRGQGAAGADGNGFRLNIANAVFGQTGYEFLPDYLDVLALNYGAGLSLLDFMEDAEGARQLINEWVATKTEDRIPELLPQGVIEPSTRLVLTNAVYFNAAWQTPFDPDNTLPGTFHALSGDVTVPMMSGILETMRQASGTGYEAAALPYDGEELEMVIIMPDAGTFPAFEASLDTTVLTDILASLGNSRTGMVIMPRFEFRFKSSMVELFQALGLASAFDATADFSGMDGTRNLVITEIVHEAFINVNEAGTEAAAATGVVVGETSAPLPITIDRPFLFLIRDIGTGSILFLGRVVNPA